MKNIIRWILVLPSSLLVSFVVFALSQLGYMFIFGRYFGTDAVLSDISALIASNAVCACSFIATGTLVAPSHRMKTGYVLTGIMCVLALASIILSLYLYHGKELINNLIGCAVMIIASIVFSINGLDDIVGSEDDK